MPGAAEMLAFLRTVGALKRTKRAGWVRCGVPGAESVSDHMYRMCVMALALAPVRRERVMKMAAVHDLAEAVVGDITPYDGVTDADKVARERAALARIVAHLAPPVAAEIRALWEEYERGDTEDARLVKDFDKFEMILQADEYEQIAGVDLQQFFDSTQGVFATERVRELVRELCAQREKRRNALMGQT